MSLVSQAEGAGAMYGSSQAVPDRSIVQEVVKRFYDVSSRGKWPQLRELAVEIVFHVK